MYAIVMVWLYCLQKIQKGKIKKNKLIRHKAINQKQQVDQFRKDILLALTGLQKSANRDGFRGSTLL